MLKPSRVARGPERILLYGGAGVGKSSCWVDIAQKMYEGNNPGHVYVVDTDNAVEPMFEFYPHLEGLVEYWPCYSWEDLTAARDAIKQREPTTEDWTVLDMLSMPYTEIRRYYTEIIHGKDLEEYLLESAKIINLARQSREKGEKGGGSDRDYGDWTTRDWDHMGKIYLNWELPLTLHNQGHVLGIAEERELLPGRASTEQIKRFRQAGGFRPYVNKTAEHRFRSVIRVSSPGSSREMTLVKDRYREEKWEEVGIGPGTIVIGDMYQEGGFVKSYLKAVAGWRFRKEER